MTPPRRQLQRPIARAVGVAGAILAIASCGSRTGLFGPDEGALPPDPDSGVDGRLPDSTADGTIDARDGRVPDATLDAPPDGPVACIPGTFGFGLATSQLLFLIDRSGSMNYALGANEDPAPGEASRWIVLHDALAATLGPFANEIAMGARFFPGEIPGQGCNQDPSSLAIAPALGNAQNILDTFFRTAPTGGTPTADVVALGAQQLADTRAVARAIVLATDGAPNCNFELDRFTCTCTFRDDICSTQQTAINCLDDTRAIAAVRNVFDVRRIPVYVIGIGVVAGFAPTLDAMAVAGGRPRATSPRYLPAETPGELRDALTVVRDSVAACSYITPSAPEDPNAIAVVVDGRSVVRDPAHLDGWDWIDRDYGHLQLFGPACAAATRTNVAGTVACRDRDR